MKKYIITLLLMAWVIIGTAQPTNNQLANIQAPTPEIAAMGKFIDIPVGHFTGAPSIGVPIHTLVEGPLQVSISINNNGSGIRASESASWVGLGWSLNAGGVISRTVLGLPDETPTSGYLNHSKNLQSPAVMNEIAEGLTDGEPDLFTFSFPGGGGKFVLNKNYDWRSDNHVDQFPKTDIKISTGPSLEEFTITTPDGTKYFFGESGTDNYDGFTLIEPQGTVLRSSSSVVRQQTEWYLRKIESHDGQFAINFTYREEVYGLVSPTSQQIAYVYSQLSGSGGSWPTAFSLDASFGTGGQIANQGSFQILSAGNGRTTHELYASFQGFESKMISQITTSTTEVNFIESTTKREDVNSHPYVTSIIADELPFHDYGALDKIEVKSRFPDPSDQSLAICKEFNFNYTYFKSVETPIYTFDQRLYLASIQEKACGPTGPQIPAYTFEYYKDPGKSYPFMPWRLTQATDAWGYYNGQTDNDTKRFNIPEVQLTYYYQQSNNTIVRKTSDAGFGVSNRNSFETPMLYGALKRINFPEGGYTELDLEANTAKELEFDTIIGTPTTPLLRLNSCNLANPNDPLNACCPNSQVNDRIYNFSQDFIDKGVIEVCLMDVGCEDDDASTPWNGNVIVTIRRTSDNTYVGQVGFNDEVDRCELYKLREEFPALLSMGPGDYTVAIQSGFAYGEVNFKEEQYTDVSFNKTVGGLRLKEKRTYDSQDNLLLSKSFDYQLDDGSGSSSGRLYVNPFFGQIVGSDVINFQNISGTAFFAKFSFNNNPYVPLSDIQGYHIGYSNVTETQANGAYTKYKFKNYKLIEGPSPVDDGYPLAPVPYIYDNGALQYEEKGGNAGVVQKTGYWDGAVTIVLNQTLASRVEKIGTSGGGANSPELLIPNDFTYQTTGLHRTYGVFDTLDGVPSSTVYNYNLAQEHLNPITITTRDSEGTEYIQRLKYPFEAQNDPDLQDPINDELINRNILVPIEQTEEVNGDILKGTRMLYKSFNGHPYVEHLYNYEVSWDENGSLVSAGPDPWVLRETVNTYTTKGQPSQVTRSGWAPQNITWNAQNHQVEQITFLNYTWNRTYYHSSLLLESMTDIDGQVVNYEYDLLGRLTHLEAREGNVSTDFEYYYKNQHAVRKENHTVTHQQFLPDPQSQNESLLRELTTMQYFDEIGRPIQSVKKAYSPNAQDVVSHTVYDAYGRPYLQYEPFEGSGVDGLFYPNAATLAAIGGVSTTTFEETPLNRPASVTPPGWNYPTQMIYGNNQSTITVGATTYNVGKLNEEQSIDGNGNRTYIYKDIRGRTVLSRKTDPTGQNPIETGYIFDHKDRVATILPPGVGINDADLLYKYLYDGRDRVIEKKIPDSDPMKYWYNERDLQTYMQDGNMQVQNRALRTEYDGYGRTIKTGFTNIPSNGDQSLSYNQLLTQNSYYGQSEVIGQRHKLEQSQVLVLDGGTNFITTNFHYDAFGRVQYSEGNNHLNIGSSTALRTDFIYDFADNIVQEQMQQLALGINTTTYQKWEYDHSGRSIWQSHQLNSNPSRIICNMNYSAEDELTKKRLGPANKTNLNVNLQEVDYSYNEQGWLIHINEIPTTEDLFNLEIRYNDPDPLFSAKAAYNGNISQLKWQTRNGTWQTYGFEYDHIDRLESAEYGTANGATVSLNNRYNTSYTYDVRGNLMSLNREGRYESSGSVIYGQIDQLTYAYTTGTNRLRTVTDATSTPGVLEGFKPASTSNEYTYDENGNLILDPYKDLNVDYNYLNLCEQVTRNSDGSTITYLFDAAGNKLQKKVTYAVLTGTNTLSGLIPSGVYQGSAVQIDGSVTGSNEVYVQGQNSVDLNNGFFADAGTIFLAQIQGSSAPISNTRDYLAGFEYLDGQLDQLPHAEGRIFFKNGAPLYSYALKDHLGNTRIVFADENEDNSIQAEEISEEMHYYPFGLTQKGDWNAGMAALNKYRFTYNGKEENNELGLEWLSYGAREYDAAIGRFMATDRFAEKYTSMTPYQYGSNSPINFIDVNGDSVAVYDAEDRATILEMINSRARGTFGFNEDGQLYLISKKGKDGSRYYRNQLIEGINSERTIEIDITQNSFDASIQDDGSIWVDKTTSLGDVDELYDGGSTLGGIWSDQYVEISGNSSIKKNRKKENILIESADILVHELVGHAIPMIEKSIWGKSAEKISRQNAVRLENKVRRQQRKGKRFLKEHRRGYGHRVQRSVYDYRSISH